MLSRGVSAVVFILLLPSCAMAIPCDWTVQNIPDTVPDVEGEALKWSVRTFCPNCSGEKEDLQIEYWIEDSEGNEVKELLSWIVSKAKTSRKSSKRSFTLNEPGTYTVISRISEISCDDFNESNDIAEFTLTINGTEEELENETVPEEEIGGSCEPGIDIRSVSGGRFGNYAIAWVDICPNEKHEGDARLTAYVSSSPKVSTDTEENRITSKFCDKDTAVTLDLESGLMRTVGIPILLERDCDKKRELGEHIITARTCIDDGNWKYSSFKTTGELNITGWNDETCEKEEVIVEKNVTVYKEIQGNCSVAPEQKPALTNGKPYSIELLGVPDNTTANETIAFTVNISTLIPGRFELRSYIFGSKGCASLGNVSGEWTPGWHESLDRIDFNESGSKSVMMYNRLFRDADGEYQLRLRVMGPDDKEKKLTKRLTVHPIKEDVSLNETEEEIITEIIETVETEQAPIRAPGALDGLRLFLRRLFGM